MMQEPEDTRGGLTWEQAHSADGTMQRPMDSMLDRMREISIHRQEGTTVTLSHEEYERLQRELDVRFPSAEPMSRTANSMRLFGLNITRAADSRYLRGRSPAYSVIDELTAVPNDFDPAPMITAPPTTMTATEVRQRIIDSRRSGRTNTGYMSLWNDIANRILSRPTHSVEARGPETSRLRHDVSRIFNSQHRMRSPVAGIMSRIRSGLRVASAPVYIHPITATQIGALTYVLGETWRDDIRVWLGVSEVALLEPNSEYELRLRIANDSTTMTTRRR